MKKLTLILISAFLFITLAKAQEQTVKVRGVIKGLDAAQLSVFADGGGGQPIEVATTIVEKGKFELSFKENPALGKRLALYIPMLDNEQRNNDKSRRYFFLDAPEVIISAKVKGNGFSEFNVDNSEMFKQFQTAYNAVDRREYYRLADTMDVKFNAFWAFKKKKDVTRTGIAMTEADSVEFKRLDAIQKAATKAFFDSEYGLADQVLAMVDKTANRGLNVLVYDHCKGYAKQTLTPVVEKFLTLFGPEYMKNDYYLNELYEKYLFHRLADAGSPIRDFDFADINGKIVHFADFKGKYIYVNLWDVRDPEFKQNLEAIEKLCAKYSNSDEIVFLNINLNEEMDLWRNEMKNNPNMLAIQLSVNNNRGFYSDYKIGGTPRAFFFDKENKMLHFEMAVPFDERAIEYIDYMLKK